MKNMKSKSVFISGGTGSIGSALLEKYIEDQQVGRVTVFSRDEMKQWELEERFTSPKLRCVLGDVRDYVRVLETMEDHDIIIHTAALKQVSRGERNPAEFIKTNVLGTQNLLAAVREHRPDAFLFLSTDKAVNPEGNYGASKLTAERMVQKAAEGGSATRFIILRLGNVMHTRGTVVPKFLKSRANQFFTISHPESTRFHLTLESTVAAAQYAIQNGIGGEVIVPKLPAFVLSDLIRAIDPKREVQITGLSKGEKKHEVLLSEAELTKTLENENYYIIVPDESEGVRHRYVTHYNARPCGIDLMYASSEVRKLGVGELEQLVYEGEKIS